MPQEELVRAAKFLIADLSGRAKLFLAESCTGGLLSSLFTSISGASEVFWGSAIVYNNEAKKQLCGVSETVLQRHGAVSSECVNELLQGSLERYPVDLVCAVSGIAGPGGGSIEKPVGLVFLGVAAKPFADAASNGSKKCSIVEEHRFSGTREEIRNASAQRALELLIEFTKFQPRI